MFEIFIVPEPVADVESSFIYATLLFLSTENSVIPEYFPVALTSAFPVNTKPFDNFNS